MFLVIQRTGGFQAMTGSERETKLVIEETEIRAGVLKIALPALPEKQRGGAH
jgi:hypothetical protein